MKNETNLSPQNTISEDNTITNNSRQKTREGYHKKKAEVTIPSEEYVEIINGMQERMYKAFISFVNEKSWTPNQIVDEFAPYISDNSTVSRIFSKERPVKIQLILVMALRFGLPLDEILLGRKQTGYTLTTDDIVLLSGLVNRAKSCSDSKIS